MRWKLCFCWLVAALFLQAPVIAEDLNVAGRPFGGRAKQIDKRWWVDVQELVFHLGLAHHPGYGGHCVRREAELSDCSVRDLLGPGRVFVEGEAVAARDGLVDLQAALARVGSVEATARAGTRPQAYPHTPAPGHVTVLLFCTNYCPSCWKFFPVLEKWARDTPGAVLVPADIGDFGSEIGRRESIRAVPHLRIFDESGEMVADGRYAESWFAEKYGLKMPTDLKCVGAP